MTSAQWNKILGRAGVGGREVGGRGGRGWLLVDQHQR